MIHRVTDLLESLWRHVADLPLLADLFIGADVLGTIAAASAQDINTQASHISQFDKDQSNVAAAAIPHTSESAAKTAEATKYLNSRSFTIGPPVLGCSAEYSIDISALNPSRAGAGAAPC
ncbi:MAG: hypothetical protein ACR2RE_31720 [Geminicoccaceae bacterium]